MNISAKTEIENVLTCWSVAQAGSNYEKNGGPKSRWTVPLISIQVYIPVMLCAGAGAACVGG